MQKTASRRGDDLYKVTLTLRGIIRNQTDQLVLRGFAFSHLRLPGADRYPSDLSLRGQSRPRRDLSVTFLALKSHFRFHT